MKVCVAGACGKMGRRILELAMAEDDLDIGGLFDVPVLTLKLLEAGIEVAV